MKKVLIVAQFTQLPGEIGNNRGRFKLIAEMLSQKGFSVTVVTSKFRELDRSFRRNEEFVNEASYKIMLLNETGYNKNISFKRIYSMKSFSRSLTSFLYESDETFDLIYACVPGLDSALVAGKYANEKGIPFLIDIQDVWPEVMYKLICDIPVISNIMFYPLQRMANQVYSLADGIMAVSRTYLEIAVKKNNKSKINDYVFIGTDLDNFDNRVSETVGNVSIRKENGEYWISYIGSLGHSYDIKTFIRGAHIAKENGINIRPIIIGRGPLEREFKSYADELSSNAFFVGWVDHGTMVAYLKESDAVINAIVKKSPASITNKVGDYLSSGKPMLNGSMNEEFRELLDEYKFGFNYEPENPESLSKAIVKVCNLEESERIRLGRNARNLAEEKFNRKKTYNKIIDMISSFLD